jgi:hypothetical protein
VAYHAGEDALAALFVDELRLGCEMCAARFTVFGADERIELPLLVAVGLRQDLVFSGRLHHGFGS